MSHFYFYLGLALLLVHEQDAINKEEWRIFPLTSFLPSGLGYLVFVAVHLPLYLFIFYKLIGPFSIHSVENFMWWMDLFFLFHLALHLLYLRHPLYRFNNPFSWIWIVGPAVFGAADLIFK